MSNVYCRYCGVATTSDLLESHESERCPRRTPIRPRNDVEALRGAASQGGIMFNEARDLPRIIALAHSLQRACDVPPTPWTNGLRAAGLLRVAPSTGGAIDKPWTNAIRLREEAQR